MNRVHIAVLLAAVAAAPVSAQPTAAKPDVKPEGLVVHEWGTFTSFSGPSGEIRPFRIALGEDLPDFVQGRAFGNEWESVRNIDSFKQALSAEQRMETPVIYFYSDTPQDVSVHVRMPQGLITEVFPPVTAYGPDLVNGPSIPSDGSAISWDHIHIVPNTCCDFIAMPQGGESHYFQARATKANSVTVKQGDQNFGERFLFYRGIGRGDMGLKARALGDDQFVIDKSEAGPLCTVFAVEVAGDKVRFSEARDVKAGDKLSLPSQSTTGEALGAAMTDALARAGLFPDEAKAMVNTWKSLWFGESGTRVMAIMPRASIDQALPLDISPSPTQTSRVFVARLEMLTPERLRWTEDVVARMDTGPAAQREAAALELNVLGRFRDPAVTIARDDMARNPRKPAVKAD